MSKPPTSKRPALGDSHATDRRLKRDQRVPSPNGLCVDPEDAASGRGGDTLAAPPAPPPILARAPDFLLTLTRALLETMDLRRILYVILTGATAGDGLGFNRAFFWLEDEGERTLRGQLAVGPESWEDAQRIWEAMEAEKFNLALVMARYDAFISDSRASRLTGAVEHVCLPHPVTTPSPAEGLGEGGSFLDLLGQVMIGRCALVRNQPPVPIPSSDILLSNFALAPLLLSDRAIGVLAVDNPFNGRPISLGELHDLQTLANLAAVAVERARLYERLRRMAELDGLTGLLNRRSFDERLAELFIEARRHDEPLSLFLLDADGFKEVNDLHGHLAGDDLLRSLARTLSSRLRQGDVAARYGGDELVAILPRATGPEALTVAEYLCQTLRQTPVGPEGALTVSVSIGVAELLPHHAVPAELLQAADQALYQAKRSGRDQARLGELPDPGRRFSGE